MKGTSKQIALSMDDLPLVKTLRVMWSASSDQFSFSAAPLVEDIVLTKRNFLSKISTLFYSLGFIMPFVVSWFSGIDWDDQLLEKKIKETL